MVKTDESNSCMGPMVSDSHRGHFKFHYDENLAQAGPLF
jgi:hypothetical protein